jgi:hypothetical protein
VTDNHFFATLVAERNITRLLLFIRHLLWLMSRSLSTPSPRLMALLGGVGDFSFVHTKFYSKKFILSTTFSFFPNFRFYSSKIYIVVCEVKKKNCSGESIVEEVQIILNYFIMIDQKVFLKTEILDLKAFNPSS